MRKTNHDRRRRASSRRAPCLLSSGRDPNDALGNRAREVRRYGLVEGRRLFIIVITTIDTQYASHAAPPSGFLFARSCVYVVRTEDTLIKPARERNGIRMWEGERDARTPKRNHVNLPVSPSDGESAKDALGSSRHTRSWGILRDCINASTPCSWHSTCAAATGEAESEVVPVGGLALVSVVKAAEREALVALERFVKATDAPGPASVRMCYDYGT